MSSNLHFMEDTKAPEAKQEAEKPQFPESSPTQESPPHLTPFNLATAVLPTLWSWKLKYREANSSHKGAQLGSHRARSQAWLSIHSPQSSKKVFENHLLLEVSVRKQILTRTNFELPFLGPSWAVHAFRASGGRWGAWGLVVRSVPGGLAATGDRECTGT